MNLGSSATLSFWARAYTSQYPEAFRVLYSTTTNTYTAFTNYLAGSASTSISPPETWTSYSYTLPQNAKYFAIQCVSNDAFFLMVDDVKVSDGSTPPPPTFGNLSGYVYRSGTTTPVSNALVTVGTKQAYTNPTGFYQIDNILTGTVTATCSAPGMFYHPHTQTDIQITQGNTTNIDFGLTWGELQADPAAVIVNLYQGETGASEVLLSNPGGTANTLFAGFFASAARAERISPITDIRKPHASKHGTSIERITGAALPERGSHWFSYADISDANYFSGARTERGNIFWLSDFSLMDGAITISQLRSYFYNPSSAAWTTSTHRQFKWKIYSVSPDGTVANVHTSATITLPSIATNSYTLSEHTLASPVTIPAGYDFIVTVAPASTSDTSGRPQSLATDASMDNGIVINGSSLSLMGLDVLLDAYVDGNEWMSAYNFSGTIPPGGSVSVPLEFNAVDVSEGSKYALMYVANDAHYLAPDTRGDMMVIPITLNVTIPSEPVAVLLGGNNWETFTEVGSPSSSGNIFTLKNSGPGNLVITSITGLDATPFTTNIDTSISLGNGQTHSFGFTFTPTQTGIWNATFTINTNGGSKSITLKGYGNYFVESFEGVAFPPDGWMLADVDGDGNNWAQFSVAGTSHSGNNSAASASYVNESKDGLQTSRMANTLRGALTPNNWLITPRLAVPDDGVMGFWVAAQDPAYPQDHYSVKLSTTTNQISAFTTTLFSETIMSGDWAYREINLNEYAGQDVYLAFQHHDCTDWYVMKIDDVLLPPLAAPLLYGNITGRVRKAGTDEYLEGVNISVAGRNFTTAEDGSFTINDIVVETYTLTASKTGYVTYSSQVTIVENQTTTHNFALDYSEFHTANTTFEMNAASGQSASRSFNLANTGSADLDWEADCGIWGGPLFPSTPLDQDFEDANLEGWSGLIGPNTNIYTGYGHNSDLVWVFASNGTTSPQYIISPKLRVSSGDNLSFWYKQFNLRDEVLNVLISTTDDAIASFTNTLANLGPLTDQDWHQYTGSLNAFAEQDIYICFYYPRTDGDQYGYILIDDITGPATLMPASEWLSVNPVTGNIAAGNNAAISLNADASNLPEGIYTAQAWFFGSATNSPYKLYVTLTVTEPLGVEAPENLIMAVYDTYVEFGWDAAENANGYRLYGSSEPHSGYIELRNTDDTFIELSWAELAWFGLNANHSFFHVKADTDAPRAASVRPISSRNFSLPLKDQLKGSKAGILHKIK